MRCLHRAEAPSSSNAGVGGGAPRTILHTPSPLHVRERSHRGSSNAPSSSNTCSHGRARGRALTAPACGPHGPASDNTAPLSSSSSASLPSTSGRPCASGASWPLLPGGSRVTHMGFWSPYRAGGRRAITAAAAAAAGPDGSGRGGGSGDVAVAAAVADAPRVEEPSTALLLAWFACGNRSLFAAQCLVEVVVELYREGRSFGELQLSLKLATQGARRQMLGRGNESGSDQAAETGGEAGGEQVVMPPLLQAQEEDVLVSWVALVFLTLEELGVPRDRDPQREGQSGKGPAAGQAPAGPTAAADFGGGFAGAAAPGVVSGMAAGSTYLRGMLGYVRQTLGMYDEGQTLARVAGLQGLVQQSAGAASSPFLVLMQQYTRLVLLTVEVVAASGLATTRPLRPPETVLRASGYSNAFSASCSAVLDGDSDEDPGSAWLAASAAATASTATASSPAPDSTGAGSSGAAAVAETGAGVAGPREAQPCPARGLAVRLLMAFMGAVLGSPWSLGKFVEAVRVAYDQGLAADELFSQLDEQEFVQSGGLLPVASPAAAAAAAAEVAEVGGGAPAAAAPSQQPLPASPASPPQPLVPQHQITKALLSAWISLSYMALAQLGVPYPAASERLGWAWAGFGDPIEAIGMNDFVGNVLRQMAGADPRVVPPLEPGQDPAPPPPPPPGSETEGPAAALATAEPLGVMGKGPVEAETGLGAGAAAAAAAGAASRPSRRRGEALMVRMEDETLPNTSTAFQVLSQQVALVQAVCRDVVRESQG